MYKTIEISDVIGTAIHENNELYMFSISEITIVMEKVSAADRFIRVNRSRSAWLRVEDLADDQLYINDGTITFLHPERCRKRFVNSFYSLDRDTQKLLGNIVKEVFEHE